MKIKMIELLSIIANGKDIPELIEYKGERYYWVEGGHTRGYRSEGLHWLYNQYANYYDDFDFLNDEVEIIEKDEPIEDLKIARNEKNNQMFLRVENHHATMRKIDVVFATKINELVKEINKMKEKGNE